MRAAGRAIDLHGPERGPEDAARPRPLVVIGSIVALWLLYGVLGSVRAALFYPFDAQLYLLGLRAEVGLSSIAITAVLYLALSRFDARRLPVRIVLAAVACLAAAAGFAFVNAAIYRGVPVTPGPMASPMVGMALSALPQSCDMATWSDLVAEYSVTGYFLMAAWSALYLALGYAAEVAGWERRAAALRAAAQTAQLRALRFQVNPHFLFNTLNSLSALVMAGRTREAEEVIEGLSSFFRASLTGDPTQDVTLADEIALQRLYLAIELRRFPNRLRVVVDIPALLEDALVPGMILQPLVENAIRHGVARSAAETRVRITADTADGHLHLRVEDDARPAVSDGSDVPSGFGVGLRNVAERLEARYGDAASIDAGPAPDGGFVVRLTLPLTAVGR